MKKDQLRMVEECQEATKNDYEKIISGFTEGILIALKQNAQILYMNLEL